jgi:acetate kinase
MSADLLLTLNAGSSIVKIALFEVAPSGTRRAAKGLIDFRGNPPSFRITEGATTFDVNLKTNISDIRGVMAEAFGWLATHFDMGRVTAVGHRVVYGGDSFAGPVCIDDVGYDLGIRSVHVTWRTVTGKLCVRALGSPYRFAAIRRSARPNKEG